MGGDCFADAGLSASSTPIARNDNHQGSVAGHCTNASVNAPVSASALRITLRPGRYVVAVESHGASSVPGAFTITMTCATAGPPATLSSTRPPIHRPASTDADDPCNAVGCSENCERVDVSTPSLRIDVTWNRANDMVR